MKTEQNKFDEHLLEKSIEQQDHDRLATARYLDSMSAEMNDLSVPAWQKNAVFEQAQTSYRQPRQILPWFSVAFSLFAVCLVLFNVNVVHNEQGVTIAFNSTTSTGLSPTEVEGLLEEKLAAYQQEQDLALAQVMMQVQKDQNQNNLQLATYLLDSARKERKQDLSDVILHFSDQMAEQSSQQQIQFNQLERAVGFQQTSYKDTSL